LRDLFLGHRRFEDLRRQSGIARGTLTSRLNSLREHGILYRNPYQDSPTRYEYRLTDKGLGLYPVALMIWSWEHRWRSDNSELPGTLTHQICNQSTIPELHCKACGQAVYPSDVSNFADPEAVLDSTHKRTTRRRRRIRTQHSDAVDESFFAALDVVGDRWTGMMIAAIWFRQHRYDDIASAIGIATNILADRLKHLTSSGILERRPYRRNPDRHEYRLTEKGHDLYGLSIMLHQWGKRWLLGKRVSSIGLKHCCGSRLTCEVVCSACKEPLEKSTVRYANHNT
jgi:DNA-binding HxlR family transcriptional regulator